MYVFIQRVACCFCSLIAATYKQLGLRTYFTCGPKESRAWTIVAGMTAPQACTDADLDTDVCLSGLVSHGVSRFD